MPEIMTPIQLACAFIACITVPALLLGAVWALVAMRSLRGLDPEEWE